MVKIKAYTSEYKKKIKITLWISDYLFCYHNFNKHVKYKFVVDLTINYAVYNNYAIMQTY